MAERREIIGPGEYGAVIHRKPVGPVRAWSRTKISKPPGMVSVGKDEYVSESEFQKLTTPEQAFLEKQGVVAFNIEQQRVHGQQVTAYEEAIAFIERERVQQEEWYSQNIVEVGPDREPILRTQLEAMAPEHQELLKAVGITQFNVEISKPTPDLVGAPTAEFEVTHTRLPVEPGETEGKWIDNKQLSELQEASPKVYEALITGGFAAADKVIQDQRDAMVELGGYAVLDAPVGTGIPFRYLLEHYPISYDLRRFIADHPETEQKELEEILLTAGFTQEVVAQALEAPEALGVEYAGYTAGQAQVVSMLSGDYIPTVEEYDALVREKLSAGETVESYKEKYGDFKESTAFLGVKWYPGGGSMWEYENIPTSLATKPKSPLEPELTRDQFIKNYYENKGWDISAQWATPQVQAQYSEAKEAYNQYKIAETGIMPKKDFLVNYYKTKGWDTSEVESVLERVVFAMTPEMQARKDRFDEAKKAYQQTGGEPAISHDTFITQYLQVLQSQGIKPTEAMRIEASNQYRETYGFVQAFPSQMLGMVTRAGFPSARVFYPEYELADIQWWEHLITAINVAAITSPLWLPPVARAIGRVLPKKAIITEAQVVNLADDVLSWGNKLSKARGDLAATRTGTTAFTRATQSVQYAEVQYNIASSNLEHLLSRAYMTPSSIPGQLSLQDIANMRYMKLGMSGQEFPLQVYGKAFSGMGPIPNTSGEMLNLIKNSPNFTKLSPAEQSKLFVAVTDYYKGLEGGVSGYMISPDDVFYQATTLVPPPVESGAISKLPPTGLAPKAFGEMYPGYFAGGETGLLVAPGGKWAPFAKGTTQTLTSPFLVPTGEMTITTASGAKVVIRSPRPGTGVTGTAVVPSTRTMTPEQLAKLEGQVEFIPYIVYETTSEGLIVPKVVYYPVAVPLPETIPITPPKLPIEAPIVTPTRVVTPARTIEVSPEVVVPEVVAPKVEPTTEPVIKTAIEPSVEPLLEPAVEPAAEPAVELAVEPVVETVVEPITEPITEPAAPFEPPLPPPPLLTLIPREGEEKLEVTVKQLAEGVTFRQGLIWIVKLPPLTGIGSVNVYTMDAPPPAQVYRADVGLPRETVSGVRTGAKPPKGDFTVPWGLFNIHYKDGILEYLPSGKTPMEVIKEPLASTEKSAGLEFEVERKARLKSDRRKSTKPTENTHPGLKPPELEPPSLKRVQL